MSYITILQWIRHAFKVGFLNFGIVLILKLPELKALLGTCLFQKATFQCAPGGGWACPCMSRFCQLKRVQTNF